MQHTQNYQLSRWEKDDRIMMEDFNADNAKLDAALKANADAVSALQTGKADAAALSEETSARTAADSSFAGQLAALAANLGVHGHNCRIATGSYVGTGGYGESNPVSLSFDFVPMLIYISSDTAYYQPGNSFLVRPLTKAHGQNGNVMTLTWAERGVTWYTTETTSVSQNNKSGQTYYYFALGYDEATEESAAE